MVSENKVQSDQIKRKETAGTCGTYGGKEEVLAVFGL
jgi:hypothetical protein